MAFRRDSHDDQEVREDAREEGRELRLGHPRHHVPHGDEDDDDRADDGDRDPDEEEDDRHDDVAPMNVKRPPIPPIFGIHDSSAPISSTRMPDFVQLICFRRSASHGGGPYAYGGYAGYGG